MLHSLAGLLNMMTKWVFLTSSENEGKKRERKEYIAHDNIRQPWFYCSKAVGSDLHTLLQRPRSWMMNRYARGSKVQDIPE